MDCVCAGEVGSGCGGVTGAVSTGFGLAATAGGAADTVEGTVARLLATVGAGDGCGGAATADAVGSA